MACQNTQSLKRRTWRKLSLVVDPISHEIIVNNLTSSNTHDSIAFLPMILKLPNTLSTRFGEMEPMIFCYYL